MSELDKLINGMKEQHGEAWPSAIVRFAVAGDIQLLNRHVPGLIAWLEKTVADGVSAQQRIAELQAENTGLAWDVEALRQRLPVIIDGWTGQPIDNRHEQSQPETS